MKVVAHQSVSVSRPESSSLLPAVAGGPQLPLTAATDLPLSVSSHLPHLFHVITMLANTGEPLIRAITHGLLVNVLHSVCTANDDQLAPIRANGENACPS